MKAKNLTKLADVCESVRYGYTASASPDPCGPHFLRITDIVPDSINWESVPYCKISDVNRERFALTIGDIVVARTGATVGYAKLIREPADAVFASYLVRFRVDPTKAQAGFVGRLVESDLYKSFVRSRMGGAAQPNASAPVLGSFEFHLPDKHTQIRISEKLSIYDNLIKNNTRRIELLEQSARLLFEEWFLRLRYPGHEHDKISDGIPQKWQRKKLAELCESIDYGYTASAQVETVGPKYLRITDIVQNVIDWNTVPYCAIEDSKREKFSLREGDIVIARTGATVGYAKRLHKRHPDSVFASYLVRLRLKPDVDNLFVGLFVESEAYKKFVRSRIGGAAQPNANARVLASAEILLPTPELQMAYHEFARPLADQRELLWHQNMRLANARDLLLPRLMDGRIEV